MTDFNASQAAKRIGISDRTIRRWLKPDKHGNVKLASIRTESGQLAIASADVERLRQEVEEERTRFVTPTHTYAATRPEMPTHDIDIEQRLASMAQSIANLNATVANQTRRIGELAARVAQFEAQASLDSPTQSVPPSTAADIIPQTKPQKQPSGASSAIPDDWTLCSDFLEGLGLKETTFRRWLKDGLGGEQFEFEKRDKYKYFTPAQQEQAIYLLRKHGKLS